MGYAWCRQVDDWPTTGSETGLSFFDLDQEIIAENATSITDIFSHKGEDYFRQSEADLLRKLTRKTPTMVLATGGGAPCFHQNEKFMLAKGRCIFLNVPIKVLAQRLLDEGQAIRPLLKGISPQQLVSNLEQTLESRSSYFHQAHIVVKGADISVQQVLREMSAD
ncbi:MAG: shikimate kinase [Cyclobacteriaceae bacterium]